MDPLEYFSRFLDIPEMILNHLSAKDLIQVSEVSIFYYNYFASSRNFVKNIKIVLSDKHEFQTEDCDLLKNSSRQYQNIEVRRTFDPEEILGRRQSLVREADYIETLELNFILSKARDWKSVSINETYFRTKPDLWNFLSSIESTVESFSVNISKTRQHEFDDESSFKVLKFPKLKHLKMHFRKFYFIGEAYARFLLKSVAIENFDFEANDEVIRDNVLSEMLVKFGRLESLKLKTHYHWFKDEIWDKYKFKPKSLMIITGYARQGLFYTINFRKFLELHIDQIEELSIDVGYNKEIFNMIKKMKKLKILSIRHFEVLSENDFPEEELTSITHLRLTYFITKPVTLKFLLKSMPNVKSLYIYVIDKGIFQTLLDIDREYDELKVVCLNDVEEKDLEIFLINENDNCIVESFD